MVDSQKGKVRASGLLEGLRKQAGEINSRGRLLIYPCGIVDIQASENAIFRPAGWERAEKASGSAKRAGVSPEGEQVIEDAESQIQEPQRGEGESLERSVRRARSRVRRLALASAFRWFVTLTLSPEKIDRYDEAEVIRRVGQWLSNQVKRKGLSYILVPERHQDGAIHFHGFFAGELECVDSGTVKVPGSKKPRKPRSERQRGAWLAEGGQVVYNLPGWTFGYSTAMELQGEYAAAVGYVCKYIDKDSEKIGGRWYYSGGALGEPRVLYVDISPDELLAQYGRAAFRLDVPGNTLAIVNGIKYEEEKQSGN